MAAAIDVVVVVVVVVLVLVWLLLDGGVGDFERRGYLKPAQRAGFGEREIQKQEAIFLQLNTRPDFVNKSIAVAVD